MQITELINQMESKRVCSLNLVASENLMSEAALHAMRSDLGHRYLIPEERPAAIWDYPNQEFSRKIAELTEGLAKRLYGGEYADVRPLSGNQIAYIVVNSFIPHGGTIFCIPDTCGGHFATVPICEREQVKVVDIPYDMSSGMMDIPALKKLYEIHRPELIFLDSSMILFPHPTAQIRDALGDEAVISNDCSHVLGLVAGQGFANPLAEGADLIHGSTHKSLFGPQKGLIVCRENGDRAGKIRDTITPLFVSNAHVHHIAALGIALEEMELFGQDYASQVVRNAQTLGSVLDQEGLEVFARDKGYTQSHQIWCVIGNRQEALAAFTALQEIHIHLNCIKVPFTNHYGFRIGLSELTRRGFQESEIVEVGHLMAQCLRKKTPYSFLKRKVENLSLQHPNVLYTFEDKPAYASGGIRVGSL